MKVTGICKDCLHRWQYGAKGQPQHLYCNLPGSSQIVKNHKLGACKFYQKANEEHMRIIRKRMGK